jgi:hypothetical protein
MLAQLEEFYLQGTPKEELSLDLEKRKWIRISE